MLTGDFIRTPYAFYDPSSQRMKLAVINHYNGVCVDAFGHRGRLYRASFTILGGDEPSFVFSKSGGVLGFGYGMPADAISCNDWNSHPYSFRTAFNARNAVVNGLRNELHPGRDGFKELVSFLKAPRTPFSKQTIEISAYWYFTETWEEFEALAPDKPTEKEVRESLEDKNVLPWSLEELRAWWPLERGQMTTPVFVWEGIDAAGQPEGDAIICLDGWGGGPLCLEFEPATENLPQPFIDARTFRPPPPETS
ncbi:MAG: hypothetical protein M2R45_04184 [Verrucomicrobia subdivision 3 bacterium]|nr:hypothetical protein [Limisphaerales bacterium]MCS1413011.1 hypothetical protein [Limisphaerales bacterium]